MASLPDRCPHASDEPSGCRVKVHHERERKTGPCFPLTVARCATHGHAFTLYPPGHVPYGRKSVVPASVDEGRLLLRAKGEFPSDEMAGAEDIAWESTVFVAATDAAGGRAWPREGTAYALPREPGGSCAPNNADAEQPAGTGQDAPGRWATQLRWLERDALMLGLEPDLADSVRLQVATQLSLPGLLLRDKSTDYAALVGYQGRGQAIVALLDSLTARPCLPDDMLACGFLVGLWGPPLRWEPDRGVLRRAFLGAGTPRSDAPDGAGPVVTKLGT